MLSDKAKDPSARSLQPFPDDRHDRPDDEAAQQARGAVSGLIEEHATLNTVSVDLVRAVIQAESAFNPRAVSPKGALGLMQLMPATAAEFGVTDAFNPEQNVRAGVKYLKQLLDTYDGRVELALAAYNAGPRGGEEVRRQGAAIPRDAELRVPHSGLDGSRITPARCRRGAPSTGRCRSSTAARSCATPPRQVPTRTSSSPPSGSVDPGPRPAPARKDSRAPVAVALPSALSTSWRGSRQPQDGRSHGGQSAWDALNAGPAGEAERLFDEALKRPRAVLPCS